MDNKRGRGTLYTHTHTQSTLIKFQNISLLCTITFIYLRERDIVMAGIQE